MSCYDDNGDDGGSLYDDESQYQGSTAQPQQQAAAASTASSPSPSTALVQAAQLVADPGMLAQEVLAPAPSQSKLPQGLAILGACAFAVLWAASIDKKAGR